MFGDYYHQNDVFECCSFQSTVEFAHSCKMFILIWRLNNFLKCCESGKKRKKKKKRPHLCNPKSPKYRIDSDEWFRFFEIYFIYLQFLKCSFNQFIRFMRSTSCLLNFLKQIYSQFTCNSNTNRNQMRNSFTAPTVRCSHSVENSEFVLIPKKCYFFSFLLVLFVRVYNPNDLFSSLSTPNKYTNTKMEPFFFSLLNFCISKNSRIFSISKMISCSFWTLPVYSISPPLSLSLSLFLFRYILGLKLRIIYFDLEHATNPLYFECRFRTSFKSLGVETHSRFYYCTLIDRLVKSRIFPKTEREKQFLWPFQITQSFFRHFSRLQTLCVKRIIHMD